MRKGWSKLLGIVMCSLKAGLLLKFVAQKESLTNIRKRLKMYTMSVLLTISLTVVGLHELQVLKQAK